MATLPRLLAALAIAGLATGGALAQTAPSADTTPPGTGAADLPHGPIVNGKQLQPRDLYGNPLGGSPGLDPKKP